MIRKVAIKASIFIILVSIIIAIINPVFILKTWHYTKLIQGLYENNGDSYDVALFGSSHMNGGIDPNVLWHEYGITSFNYATAGESLDVTYYLLKEVLKQHKNPIVVVDLYYLGLADKYDEEGYIRYVLDSMKFSTNKLDAIMNCVPAADRINYLFPIFKYHYRWDELTADDLNLNSSQYYYAKGFDAGTNRYGKDNTSSSSVTGMADIPPKSEEYLYKIIDLSKKEGFKLIFTNTPYDYNETNGESDWVKEPAKMFNTVAKIAKNNAIPFIDYNAEADELGFDFADDMNNEGHVNIWGADKLSMDLGKYLKANYALVDHRSDSKYADWNTEYMSSQVANIQEQKNKS